MIFCNSKAKIELVTEFLRTKDIVSLPYLENDKITAQMRHATLSLFKSGQLPVMVCSNLGARGLDTMNVNHLIQFEYAKSPIDLYHRVGRVGRLGQSGKVTNFVRRLDKDLYSLIRKSKGDLDPLISKIRN
jgi:superfamily II DNA/RNA helicase